MSAFNPAGLVIEYGQLDTLLTDGQTPGSHADDLFLNMLDQYDQATGSDGQRTTAGSMNASDYANTSGSFGCRGCFAIKERSMDDAC